MSRGRTAGGGYVAEAAEVLRFVEEIPEMVRDGERTIAERAALLLSGFETRLIAGGAPAPAGPPARFALAVLIDQKVRQERGIRISAWVASAHARLFDGRDISPPEIRKFRETAERSGPEYVPLAEFLGDILARLEGARRRRAVIVSAGPTALVLAGVVGLLLSLAAYAAFLDYRYHARSHAAFVSEAMAIDAQDLPLSLHLDALAAAATRVETAARKAPLAGTVSLPWASTARAWALHSEAVNAALPAAIAELIGQELATVGDNLPLYDTLRAWSVLSGETEWSAGYLAGWLDERPEGEPLAQHAAALSGPVSTVPPPDSELLGQARVFAAELEEPARAWLELTRSEGARALEAWSVEEAVDGLSDVVLRRSGRPLADGLDGLYTERGWAYARDVGAGLAVQRARDVAPAVLGIEPDRRNDSPDLLMEALQRETIARWRAWLADLRVRPFTSRDSAILISGSLAQRSSPLDRVIREVWRQAGGTDRSRPHQLQLSIATAFGAMIQYAEQGRLSEISALFSSLNVALSTIDFDEDRGAERLMSIQDRARSIRALAAAPAIVAQITEDVLAQTSAAHASLLSNPITRQWQRDVYPLCRATVNESYPFNDGPDAALSDFTQLFSPQGAMRRFVGSAERYIDTSGDVWRWKPEARLSGLSPETAEFLQRASAISGAFFGSDGALSAEVGLAALAERGEAMMFLGGDGVPVQADAGAGTLHWPGPDPAQGAEVTFREGARSERVRGSGPWGLFRVLDTTRLRMRDEGRRVLVDLRTDVGRIFLEMTFADPMNPVAARGLLSGLVCPPVL